MNSEGLVSMLAGQELSAKARISRTPPGATETHLSLAVDRSVRRTLACLVQIQDPRVVAALGYALFVGLAGELLVRHPDGVLPVSPAYTRHLFEAAGVELEAGQVLLLDEALVHALVEEALGALHQEEALIRDHKARLRQALLLV